MRRNGSHDPEGGGELRDPYDPEGGGELRDPYDPEGGGELRDPYDPEGGGELRDPYDPEGGGELRDPYDPEGGGELRDPYDPEGGGELRDPYDPEGGGELRDPYDPESEGYGKNPLGRRERAVRSSQLGRSYDRPADENSRIRAARRRFSGDIIVRLSAELATTNKPNLIQLAKDLNLKDLATVLKRFGSPPTGRAITTLGAGTPGERAPVECECERCSPGKPSRLAPVECKCPEIPPGTLSDLEERARKSDFPPRHSLWSYWRLDASRLDEIEFKPEHGFPYSTAAITRRLVYELNALSEVDLAYRELEATDPDNTAGFDTFVPPSNEMLSDFQFESGKSPLGLDIRWARDLLDRTGKRIALVDLEQGWIRDHEDLRSARLVYGNNRHGKGSYRGNHGTAVVSQLVARKANGLGIVGIASGVAKLSLASHYRTGKGERPGKSGHIADAITALVTGKKPNLGKGDVLLLEVQEDGLPAEADPCIFDAIRVAVASGVIVVEAAGNGRVNLNRLRTEDGRSLDRRSYDFRDSGAIMVGAAQAAAPHNRSWFSNYGSRVDCFGWGDSVVAAGYGDFQGGDDKQTYTDTFSGTSSAAPMIAGAAVLVQRLFIQNASPSQELPPGEARDWSRLSPGQMRSLLSDPLNGTRQGRSVRGRIGVMPNLRAVLGKALGVVPQVYLRDHVGDDGQVPVKRRYCSPDIIISNVANRDLEERFGRNSLSANNDVFDASLTSTGQKRVCVRASNRGSRDAKEAKARIYTAPVSTLTTPDRWQELSMIPASGPPSLAIGVVPQGDTLTLSKAVKVKLEKSPCLVAVLEHEGCEDGPFPCHKSNFDWPRHLRVMRSQRNVAVRNVHAVEVFHSTLRLNFKINGAPDAARAFEFEVIHRLPRSVHLHLKTHLALALKFARGRQWKVARDGSEAKLHLPRQPRFFLGITPLPAAVDFASVFALGNVGALGNGHSLAIRQLYRGEEVGRITWRFQRKS